MFCLARRKFWGKTKPTVYIVLVMLNDMQCKSHCGKKTFLIKKMTRATFKEMERLTSLIHKHVNYYHKYNI